MRHPIRDPRDFWSGLLFLAFGAAAMAIALWQGYDIGTPRKMGPGYFPIWLGGILSVIGLALAVRGLVRPGAEVPFGRLAWRPLALVTVGTLVFGLSVDYVGLAPAVAALVLITAYASDRFRLAWAVPLALGLALFSVLVFIKGLGVALPIMPHILGR